MNHSVDEHDQSQAQQMEVISLHFLLLSFFMATH